MDFRRLAALTGVLAWLAAAGPGSADEGAGVGGEDGRRVSVAELDGSNWRVEAIEGAAAADGVLSSLGFRAERIAGSGGCNRFQGAVRREGGRLVVGPLASTRRACPPAVMDQEQRYLDALGRAAHLERRGPRLLVLDADGAPLLRLGPLEGDA